MAPLYDGTKQMADATDLQGNPYLTVAEARKGIRIKLDADFSCASNHARKTLRCDPTNGLWFPCREGRHYMDGQLSDDDKFYVGVYPLKSRGTGDAKV